MRPSCEYPMIHKHLQGWTDTQRNFSASLDQYDFIPSLVGGITCNMSSNASCVGTHKRCSNCDCHDGTAVLSRTLLMHRPVTASSLQQPDQPTHAHLKHGRFKDKQAQCVRSIISITNISAYHKDIVQIDTLQTSTC
jgi:hypothetical protein